MRHSRAARHIPGLDRRSSRRQPRLSELILAITGILILLAACLRLVAWAGA